MKKMYVEPAEYFTPSARKILEEGEKVSEKKPVKKPVKRKVTKSKK